MSGDASYRVLRVPRVFLLAVLAGAGVLVATAVLDSSPWGHAPLLLLGAFAAVVQLRRQAVLLRVDERGLMLRPRSAGRWSSPLQVPWSSVARVVVRADDEVGVALLPRSPLPVGVRGVLHDPRDPRAVHPSMVRRIPGLDVGRLREAVRRATAGRVTVEQVRAGRPYS